MELLNKITQLLEDKKAIDLKTLDIKEKSTLADYFVIASGTSNTHIKALADNVEVELKKENIYPNKIEGYNTQWILMDYGDVVVHIFTEQERQNYDIEQLYEKNK
ncbi:MAG: ribosome silencing factor [Clostridia bacterium]|nr:ribosome silencing factor [Clostridia bacterium]